MKHRNSQKRIYIQNGIYFITTNTKDKFPYFDEDIFCELIIHQLEFCKKMYEINLHAYKINPDHLHLLFTVGNKYTISDVMFSLKKQSAHGINQILGYVDLIKSKNNVEWVEKLSKWKTDFEKIFDKNNLLPKFHWQKSFHDHYIKDEKDLFFHIEYIQNQYLKHGLTFNKWLFVDEKFLNFSSSIESKYDIK